jgi:septal ring factor EnvC (AmiA/AmiB activator)
MERLREEQLVAPAETVEHRPFRALKGRMPWPAKGSLAGRFGMEKRGGLLWDGVLISAPEGREVKAVHHGRVAFADWLRGFGLLLIIDHGDGYMSLYGHNQSLFKEAGDWVEQGEPVALVGNSGGRLDTGVYFGIRYQGRPVNPKHWCKKSKGNRVGMGSNLKNRAGPEAA